MTGDSFSLVFGHDVSTILVAELFVPLQIRVNTQKQVDDEDEEEANGPIVCEECGRSDRRQRLLICARCDSGYGTEVTPSNIMSYV